MPKTDAKAPSNNPTPNAKSPLPKMRKVEMQFNFNLKRMLVWFLILLLFLPGLLRIWNDLTGMEERTLSQLVDDVKNNKVEKIQVTGNKLLVN